jgi:hypothetical protein
MPVVDHPRATPLAASFCSPAQLAQTRTAWDDVACIWCGKQEILQAAQVFVAPLLSPKSDERGELDILRTIRGKRIGGNSEE